MRFVKTIFAFLSLVAVLSLTANNIQPSQLQSIPAAEAASAPEKCGICVVYDTETGEQSEWPYVDPESSLLYEGYCDG